MAAPQPLIEKPSDVSVAGAEPRVFVMAERYRGGASGLAMAEPKKDEPKPPPKPVTPPPPPPKPAAPPKPSAMPAHGKGRGKAVVIIGIVVLLLVGVGGFFALPYLTPPAEEPAPTVPPPTIPTPPVTPPVTPPPPPPVEEPTTPQVPVSPFPSGTVPGTDSDSDGLTDLEERLVYDTDAHLPDTDGDGFLDGNEVFNLYDPRVPAPATLLESGVVRLYDVSIAPSAAPLPYNVLYPAGWNPRAQDTSPFDVVFAVTTGESISVSVLPKAAPDQSLGDWVAGQGLTARVLPFTTRSGLPGISTEDQLTAYVDAGDQVIVLRYDTGIKGTVDYLQTFKMMQNSLRLAEVPAPASALAEDE